jgi:hypothetical protein
VQEKDADDAARDNAHVKTMAKGGKSRKGRAGKMGKAVGKKKKDDGSDDSDDEYMGEKSEGDHCLF